MKSNLSKNEYLQLQGLFCLMDKYNKLMKELELGAAELVGDEISNDWSESISDWIYGRGEFNALDFCKHHKIKIDKK